METVESFSEFLRTIETPNFLAIGVVIIVVWLLVSGFRKGLKKRKSGKGPEEPGDENGER